MRKSSDTKSFKDFAKYLKPIQSKTFPILENRKVKIASDNVFSRTELTDSSRSSTQIFPWKCDCAHKHIQRYITVLKTRIYL